MEGIGLGNYQPIQQISTRVKKGRFDEDYEMESAQDKKTASMLEDIMRLNQQAETFVEMKKQKSFSK
jgi:hypothetical protein